MLKRLGLALLAVGLTAAGTSWIGSSSAGAAPRKCAMFEFIGVAGSGELEDPTVIRKTRNMGQTVRDLYDKVSAAYSHSQTSLLDFGVAYPAIPVDLANLATTYPQNYANSVDLGRRGLKAELESAAAACPAEQFIVAGYSQGAQVVNAALSQASPAVLGRVRAKILFGDPLYNHLNNPEDQGYNGVMGVWDGILTWREPASPVDPADLQSRSRSYCDWRDIMCQGLQAAVATPQNPIYYWHTQYRTWATQAAANFIASIEPPASCAVSTATWSEGRVTSTSNGVAIAGDQFGFVTARPNAGYRFAGFVAVAEQFTTFPETAVARTDQVSYKTSDDPVSTEQDVVSPGGARYVLARAVRAGCGRSDGALSFSIPVAENRHVEIHGRLTYGGKPYAGAMVLWQLSPEGSSEVPSAYLGWDFGNVTHTDGTWSLIRTPGPKPILPTGTYTMRLAFPGDVNHRETFSGPLQVTVTETPLG